MNPFLLSLLKTAAVAVAGAVAPVVSAAVDHPTGGLGQALATNPIYATAWTMLSYTLHNVWSQVQLKDATK